MKSISTISHHFKKNVGFALLVLLAIVHSLDFDAPFFSDFQKKETIELVDKHYDEQNTTETFEISNNSKGKLLFQIPFSFKDWLQHFNLTNRISYAQHRFLFQQKIIEKLLETKLLTLYYSSNLA